MSFTIDENGYGVTISVDRDFANEIANDDYVAKDFGTDVAQELRDMGFGMKDYTVTAIVNVKVEVELSVRACDEDRARDYVQDELTVDIGSIDADITDAYDGSVEASVGYTSAEVEDVEVEDVMEV